jgi:hypothetical protein
MFVMGLDPTTQSHKANQGIKTQFINLNSCVAMVPHHQCFYFWRFVARMVLQYRSNVIGDLIFSLLVLKLREYVKVVEIAMVQVLGLVQDEMTFNNLAFMKSKLGNIITTHLNLCVRMFTQNFYNVSNFHMMQPLQNGKKSALDTMQIVKFFSFQLLLASCKLRVQRLLWKYLYIFSKNPNMILVCALWM